MSDKTALLKKIMYFLQKLLIAMKPHEIQEKLGLTRIRDRNWYVQPSCATTGDGLYEGLTWLTSNHKSWVINSAFAETDIKYSRQ